MYVHIGKSLIYLFISLILTSYSSQIAIGLALTGFFFFFLFVISVIGISLLDFNYLG